ncbi:NAD-dependent epimerase/dehydratase family protein [Alteromonas gilva]|uniref:NAD-dependent epimerase/dehydratase family protein n=1 Tax=Alteromonas gilva TaxID=2987522 RepID=A0ABT5L721_9ALTE|nr:NAD-dependent epimerase/dehydratase family protein [Alteromonas gilva]MDC8832286.1 NAD-dependent epimerase/dehydratase family protein [Alteromonas gilva]
MAGNSNKLLLCGCGWLGGYLASHFANSKQITGTTRSQDKAQQLQQEGVKALLFALGDNPDSLSAHSANSTVILNIPPGRRNTDLDGFTRHMCELITALYRNQPPQQLIFISTTSVYGDQDGDITTGSPVAPTTASGEAHVAIEQHIQQCAPENGYILRLAGLVGPDRHPVKSLAGRTLSGANQVVNLVHVDDVVTTIGALMTQQPKQKLWHLSSSAHPMRGEYYPKMANQLGLAPIEFSDGSDHSTLPTGKSINPQATLDALGMTLEFASPWQMKPV